MARALGLGIGLCVCICLFAGVLRAQSEEFGKWQSLFDGKDTAGWVCAKAGHEGRPAWKVEDGALTNGTDHGGMDLCTLETFRDYELEIDYKITKGGNSGVYLRGQIEVQIADNYRDGKKLAPAELGQGHAGALYSFAAPKRNPQNEPPNWNQFRVRHIGDRVTVWHNGELIQDNVIANRPTGGAMGGEFPPGSGRKLQLAEGPIMVQGDHGYVWYRNIRIRPLVSSKDGWVRLWNGKDLTGFRTLQGLKLEGLWGVDAEAQAFTNLKCGAEGKDLWTAKPYGNFLVHYEYRSGTNEGGNSGFYLRDQWEIQILANQDTKEPHSDASIYSIYPPATKARNAADEWNHMDVRVEGMKIWAWQNGKLIHDGVVCKTRTDNHGVETPKFSKGPFKLQGDHGTVWFTNLWIKELPDTP